MDKQYELKTRMVCGEEVYCLGAEKVSQVAKIQGASIKYCYGDEIAKWNKEVFQMLKSRLDKPYSCFDGACNPEHPTHWLKEFLDNDELDIYLQRYTIFDNPFLPQEFVEQLCKEYEGTIYYDRLILGLWKRAEGAIYKRFADNPEKFRCEVLEGPADNPEHKQFRKNDIVSIEIGLDFGGNQSGHSFVARGYTDDYRDVIGIMSKRVMAKDQEKDIDSNMLDQLFCDFVQEVIDKYSVIKKQGDYVEYCNVESVYYDNAETVLGNSIRNAVEKRFPWMIVRKAKKASIIDRIRCTIRLMGAGRFWITEDCKSLQTALSDGRGVSGQNNSYIQYAVWERSRDFLARTAIILIIRSFRDCPNVTGRMSGWMPRIWKRVNRRSLEIRNIPCMKPNKSNVRWNWRCGRKEKRFDCSRKARLIRMKFCCIKQSIKDS